MKIKTRLVIAFFTTVLMPVCLLCLAMLLLGVHSVRSIEETFGIDFSFGYYVNSLQVISDSTENVCSDMRQKAAEDPAAFDSFAYLQEINSELTEKVSYLVVIRNGELYYKGSERATDDLIRILPPCDDGTQPSTAGVIVGRKKRALVRQVNITFSDGGTGAAYVVTPASAVIPQVHALIIQMAVSVVFILILTAGGLTLWIYRGIRTPIRRLQEATDRITRGDLDFTVEAPGNDELSDLCRSFEMMRQRLAESEAEKARYDQENRELISNISHDLKTPITTVKGYVEGIMDGVADTPEKMERYIRTIYNKAIEMDRLINELTFYSKIDANRIPYHFTRLNAAEFFEDCAEEVSMDLEQQGVTFRYVNRTDRGVRIIADPEQLKRVIGNIITNSVKYMDKKDGFIELRILDAGDFIQVELEDNGKGISQKELPHIFDRFYRADSSRNSEQGGSGIGLSIVRKIIEDHSGKIWAVSTPGRGTTMCFVIRKYQEVPA